MLPPSPGPERPFSVDRGDRAAWGCSGSRDLRLEPARLGPGCREHRYRSRARSRPLGRRSPPPLDRQRPACPDTSSGSEPGRTRTARLQTPSRGRGRPLRPGTRRQARKDRPHSKSRSRCRAHLPPASPGPLRTLALIDLRFVPAASYPPLRSTWGLGRAGSNYGCQNPSVHAHIMAQTRAFALYGRVEEGIGHDRGRHPR